MRSAILVLAALAAALTGWAVAPFGGDGEAPANPGDPRGATGTPPSPATPSLPREIARSAPPVEPAAPLDRLAAILARFPAPEFLSGDGAITGIVVRDEDGVPLPGVAIDAIIQGTPPGWQPKGIGQEDLLACIREEIDLYYYGIAMMRRAVTDAEGRFRLEGLHPEGQYRLYPAQGEEWLLGSEKSRWGHSAGQEVHLRAARAAVVAVEVVDAAGAPIETGTLDATLPDGSGWFALSERFSPSSREFRVPTPRCTLRARTSAGWTDPVELDLAAGERRAVRLGVPSNPGVDIVVTARDPIDWIGAMIFALPVDEALGPGQVARDLWTADERAHREEVDEETGRWEADLEPGQYLVLLTRDREILVGSPGTELEFAL